MNVEKPRIVLAVALAASVSALSSTAAAERVQAKRFVEKGRAAVEAGKPELARTELARAIQADPDFLPAYEVAIPLWLEAGRLSELATYLEVATTRQRDYAFGWYTLGYVYRVQGRPELSVIAYETYLQLRPKDPDPRFGLALSLIDAGKPARARLELQRYLTMERRSERESYARRARELVVELGGVVPQSSLRTTAIELERARDLIDGFRFSSALAVLGGLKPAGDAENAALWRLRAKAHLGAGRPQAAVAAAFMALQYRIPRSPTADDKWLGDREIERYLRSVLGVSR